MSKPFPPVDTHSMPRRTSGLTVDGMVECILEREGFLGAVAHTVSYHRGRMYVVQAFHPGDMWRGLLHDNKERRWYVCRYASLASSHKFFQVLDKVVPLLIERGSSVTEVDDQTMSGLIRFKGYMGVVKAKLIGGGG